MVGLGAWVRGVNSSDDDDEDEEEEEEEGEVGGDELVFDMEVRETDGRSRGCLRALHFERIAFLCVRI